MPPSEGRRSTGDLYVFNVLVSYSEMLKSAGPPMVLAVNIFTGNAE